MDMLNTLSKMGIDTNIKIYIGDELKEEIKNTITIDGKYLLGQLMSSETYLDGIVISDEASTGETQTMFSNKFYMNIVNTYSYIDSVTGDLILVFESSNPISEITSVSSIAAIGLKSGDTLFTTASSITGSISGDQNLSIIYQLRITVTNV